MLFAFNIFFFIRLQGEVKVGMFDKSYPGYRKLTLAQWQDQAVAARILEGYRQHGGFRLLEEPLHSSNALCVAEGFIYVDGAYITSAGYTGSQQLSGVFQAQNHNTKVVWNTTLPNATNWKFGSAGGSGSPCFFISV
jgi:hypothetical protein